MSRARGRAATPLQLRECREHDIAGQGPCRDAWSQGPGITSATSMKFRESKGHNIAGQGPKVDTASEGPDETFTFRRERKSRGTDIYAKLTKLWGGGGCWTFQQPYILRRWQGFRTRQGIWFRQTCLHQLMKQHDFEINVFCDAEIYERILQK